MAVGRPLAGLRVVEFCDGDGGAFCGRILADLGADVVALRTSGRGAGRPAGLVLDAGKGVVDLERDFDSADLDALLAGADLLIEDLPAPRREQLGLGRDVEGRFPALIVVALSPYGRSSTWADRPGSDLTASALSSLSCALGEPGREPLRIPFDQIELHAASHAAAAAVTAVFERERTGRGQTVDIGTSTTIGYEVGGMRLVYAKSGRPWQRTGRLQASSAYPIGFFEASDGHVCTATQQPKHWERWLKMAEGSGWASDPAFRDGAALAKDPSHIDPVLREWMRQFTRRQLVEMALEHDIVLGAVNRFDELFEIDHFDQRALWTRIECATQTVATPRAVAWPGPAPAGGPGRTDLTAVAQRWGSRPTPVVRSVEDRPALDGVRILDFGWNWAGPMAAQLLADMGADVIKVESGRRQDLMRYRPAQAWFFEHNHRNKRSVTIDLSTDAGRDLLLRLVPHVDVVMNNFAAGVMDRLGIGYEALRAVRPDIIDVSMSMAGQRGPLAPMRGFASIATGFAGLESCVGYVGVDGMSVGLMPFGLGDTALAVQGALAVVSALVHRRRTGEGQHLDLSQIESVLAAMSVPLAEFQLGAIGPGPYGNADLSALPHGFFRSAGADAWVALSVRTDGQWRSLCDVIGLNEGASASRPEAGDSRIGPIEEQIAAWCARRSADEAAELLGAANVPAAPLLPLDLRDRHESFRDLVVTVNSDIDPGSGSFTIYDTPWRLSRSPRPARRRAPVLGAHSHEVIVGIAGLADEEYARLVTDGVIA